MLLLLSPAKSLDFESPLPALAHSEPLFVRESAKLIRVLRQQSAAEIVDLMNLSAPLAKLNVARYKAWRSKFNPDNARPALLAFDGDVYAGLDAKSLKARELDWAQRHVAILSGLYGVLRPLDLMQPYRLEMSTRLANERGANLVQFWGSRIADYLNQRQQDEKVPVVVNLASQEYARAVDRKVLRARVVDCVFEQLHNGEYKLISFLAKRARGLMARYAITHRAATPDQLQGFNAEGYALERSLSTPERLVFRCDARP